MEDYLSLIRDNTVHEYRLFEKIYPFFNGKYNHHEIMMISNCSRGKIEKILTMFSPVLEKYWLK